MFRSYGFFLLSALSLSCAPSLHGDDSHGGAAESPATLEKMKETEIFGLLSKIEAQYVRIVRDGILNDEPYLKKGVERKFSSLLVRINALQQALGITNEGGAANTLDPRMEAIEKKLGIVSEGGKLLSRLDKAHEAYVRQLEENAENAAADRFEKVYGNPAKMTLPERISQCEKFLDQKILDARIHHRGGAIPNDRMKILQSLFPEIAGNFGTINRNLPRFEAHFKLAAASENGEPLSIEDRLKNLEVVVDEKTGEKLIEKRKTQTPSERAEWLDREFKLLYPDKQILMENLGSPK